MFTNQCARRVTKRAKNLFVSLGVIFMFATLSACGTSTSGDTTGQVLAQMDTSWAIAPMTIRFAHSGANDTTDHVHYGATTFANRVSELSGGAMQVQIYSIGQLGVVSEHITMLQRGELHMGLVENAPLTNIVPEAMWADLPYVVRCYDHALALLNAQSQVSRWIRPLFTDNGLRILGVAHGGFRHMMNNVRPITNPNDMDGLVIRVMNSDVMLETMRAFGAEAVTLPFGDVLRTALITGEVDGNEQPLNNVYVHSLYEVQRFLSLTGHFFDIRNFVFSENLWQQMTPAQQLVVLDATEYTVNRMNTRHQSQQEIVRRNITGQNMVINELSAWGLNAFRMQGQGVWEQFYSQIGSGNDIVGRAILEKILSYAP